MTIYIRQMLEYHGLNGYCFHIQSDGYTLGSIHVRPLKFLEMNVDRHLKLQSAMIQVLTELTQHGIR
jgi:hypothetical protein